MGSFSPLDIHVAENNDQSCYTMLLMPVLNHRELSSTNIPYVHNLPLRNLLANQRRLLLVSPYLKRSTSCLNDTRAICLVQLMQKILILFPSLQQAK